MTRHRTGPWRAADQREAKRICSAIDREHARTWREFARSGVPTVATSPALAELIEAAVTAVRCGAASCRSGLSYYGRRYPLKTTNLGRLMVVHPATGRIIGGTDVFEI